MGTRENLDWAKRLFADRRPADPDRHRDLPLAHAKGVPQSQNFSYLPHRRSLRASDLPLHGRKGRLVRDSIADGESFRPPPQGWPASIGMGGRLPSESVPDCVGITGRFVSDYASRADRRRPDPQFDSSWLGLSEPAMSRWDNGCAHLGQSAGGGLSALRWTRCPIGTAVALATFKRPSKDHI